MKNIIGVPKRTKKSKKKSKKKKLKIGMVQVIFNRWIRNRDSVDGYFTCISCEKFLSINQMNAGHYIHASRTQFLRFNEENVWGECIFCNNYNPSHLLGYRRNLIEKIGIDKVLEFEYHDKHRTMKKWTQQELQEIKDKYTLR